MAESYVLLQPESPGIRAFVSGLRGRVLHPSDKEYEPARRVYNASIERQPQLIVRCANAADVIRCVNFAGSEGLTIAVRCGGHSVAGFGTCDGLVIDLARMQGITMIRSTGRPASKAAALGVRLTRRRTRLGLLLPEGSCPRRA